MANLAQLASIGLIAGKPLIDNSDVIFDKARDKVRNVRRKSTSRAYEDQKKDRSDRSREPDDLGPARPRGGSGVDYRSDKLSRARSAGYYDESDEDDDYDRRSRARDRDSRRRKSMPQYDAGYDSEGSIPPRDRQMVATRDGNGRGSQAMTRYGSSKYANSQYAGTYGTKSENDRSSDSSSSTSDLMDSEEDERQEKKKRRNELLTGGIAAVATLNAAANVYNSMKARELRIKQLAEGTITKEDAKKQRYKHHMQDAATIGLAALSIKGAYGKWQGTMGKHRETKAHREERMQRQEKRIQKGISRKNWESERAAAAARGRLAPGFEETARANRPKFNRQYSQSADPYKRNGGYPPGQRSYGRNKNWEHGPYGAPGHRGHDEMDAYNGIEDLGDHDGYDGYDGYDVGHA